jgi:hypothetical protein
MQWPKEKGQIEWTMIYKTLHRKLKIEHEPHKNPVASKGLAVPAPLVTPFLFPLSDVEILLDTSICKYIQSNINMAWTPYKLKNHVRWCVIVAEKLFFWYKVCLAFSNNKNLCFSLFFFLQLNAWDPKRVEEPDYLRRLAGFREVNSVIKSMTTLDTQFLHAVLVNSCFFIKSVSIIFTIPCCHDNNYLFKVTCTINKRNNIYNVMFLILFCCSCFITS